MIGWEVESMKSQMISCWFLGPWWGYHVPRSWTSTHSATGR
jgi:hypothetical protein